MCVCVNVLECLKFSVRRHTVTPSHWHKHRHTVTPSHRHTVTPTHRYTNTPSNRHTVTPTHRHTVTPSHWHKHRHTVTPSHWHTVTPTPHTSVVSSVECRSSCVWNLWIFEIFSKTSHFRGVQCAVSVCECLIFRLAEKSSKTLHLRGNNCRLTKLCFFKQRLY